MAIYEIPELPTNASILTLEEEVEKAPTLKKMPMWQKIASMVVLPVFYAVTALTGCNGNGNGPDGVNPIPSSYSVADHIEPANGTSVGPDDNPLEVGVTTPALNPDYEGAAPAGVGVVVTATLDNNTPSDTSDDETVTVVDQNDVPFDTYTSGDLGLSDTHGGAGPSDGEGITLEATLSVVDDQGETHTVDGSVEIMYEEGTTNPVRVRGCNVNASNVGVLISMALLGMF